MAYGTINADLMTTSDGVSSSGLYGFKNRIINGAMVIDQRNAGASVTANDGTYDVDRWKCVATANGKFTMQQNAGSITPPAGFSYYLGCTSTSAYSVSATDFFHVRQAIEGFNVADLGFGTANAQTITLSFWVRSSLTGTFGGSLNNNTFNRSYPYSYTISSANTWEQKSVTIAGDTTGTWLTTNSTGLNVSFSLGAGSTQSGTAGAWVASEKESATGATSVVGTNGATFYITGVQLEKGSTATSFDYRPYGTELQLCQRYFQSYSRYEECVSANVNNSNSATAPVMLIQQMRTSPSITLAPAGNSTGNIAFLTASGGFPAVIGSHTVLSITPNGFRISAGSYTASGWAAGVATAIYAATNPVTVYTASAEL